MENTSDLYLNINNYINVICIVYIYIFNRMHSLLDNLLSQIMLINTLCIISISMFIIYLK